jgi:acyl carrier protein
MIVQPLNLEKSDGRDIAEFDLNLYLTETESGIAGNLFYRTDLFAAKTIALMVGQFELLLESVVTDPDRTLTQLRSSLELATKPIPQSCQTAREQEDAIATKTWGEPANPTEVTLLRIWQEVLGIEKIGTRDNFFALGGYSMQLLQVLAKIQEAYSVDLSVAALFDRPTIAEIADAIRYIEK